MEKDQLQEEGWEKFLSACSKIKTVDQFEEFFQLFLTPEEKESLSMRYLIIKALLEEKLPQRQIAENLHISISKITRGSNALKRVSRSLKDFLIRN